jgi:hypothetical protein
MTMVAGTVTVDDAGNVTATANSMAKGIYEALAATVPAPGLQAPGDALAMRNLGNMATAIAGAVVTHIVTYGKATLVSFVSYQTTTTEGNPTGLNAEFPPTALDIS